MNHWSQTHDSSILRSVCSTTVTVPRSLPRADAYIVLKADKTSNHDVSAGEKKSNIDIFVTVFFKLEKDTGIKKIVLIGKCPQDRKTSEKKFFGENLSFWLLSKLER